MPPIIYDKEGWQNALLEHRRRLFERVVAAFPAEVKKQRTTVDIWRIRLSGPPHNGPSN
jgi:hypothetical protein